MNHSLNANGIDIRRVEQRQYGSEARMEVVDKGMN